MFCQMIFLIGSHPAHCMNQLVKIVSVAKLARWTTMVFQLDPNPPQVLLQVSRLRRFAHAGLGERSWRKKHDYLIWDAHTVLK